jgi:hypothetical protein
MKKTIATARAVWRQSATTDDEDGRRRRPTTTTSVRRRDGDGDGDDDGDGDGDAGQTTTSTDEGAARVTSETGIDRANPEGGRARAGGFRIGLGGERF